jgi:hypothetical protein
MYGALDGLPDDIDALKAVLIIERDKALQVAAELAIARAKASQDMALIAHQKLRIASWNANCMGNVPNSCSVAPRSHRSALTLRGGIRWSRTRSQRPLWVPHQSSMPTNTGCATRPTRIRDRASTRCCS